MRNDFKIALICAFASLPAGVAVSEALEYFSFLKAYPGLSFYGSSFITLVLLGIAAILAIRGERAAEQEGAKKRLLPLIGIIVFGLGFCGCAAWYFWPTETAQISEKTPGTPLSISEDFQGMFNAFPRLGKPLGPIKTSEDTYFAVHEKGTIIWLQPILTSYGLPNSPNSKFFPIKGWIALWIPNGMTTSGCEQSSSPHRTYIHLLEGSLKTGLYGNGWAGAYGIAPSNQT